MQKKDLDCRNFNSLFIAIVYSKQRTNTVKAKNMYTRSCPDITVVCRYIFLTLQSYLNMCSWLLFDACRCTDYPYAQHIIYHGVLSRSQFISACLFALYLYGHVRAHNKLLWRLHRLHWKREDIMSNFSCFVASSIIFTVVLDQVLNLSPSTNMYPHVGRFSARDVRGS